MMEKVKIKRKGFRDATAVIASEEEKFWSDVVEARKADIESMERNLKYYRAILKMAQEILKKAS